jgi:SPP1 family predicted phage head-tail adaptor
MTDAGRLCARLALEAPTETADGAGGVVRGYETEATVWVELKPLSARDAVVAAASGFSVTHRIRMRARDGLTARHRLRKGARIFRIVSVREDAAAGFLLIEAEERRD